MKNLAPLLAVVLFCNSTIYGQNEEFNPFEKALKTINAAGGDAFATEGSVAYSVGTTFYTTMDASDMRVSQGAQQSEIEIIVEEEDSTTEQPEIETPPYIIGEEEEVLEPKFEISVYPNPTSDILYLAMSGSANGAAFYEIYDIYGKRVKAKRIENEVEKISLLGLSSSTYIVIVGFEMRQSKLFKVIKN